MNINKLGYSCYYILNFKQKKFDKKIKVPIPVEKNENFPLERLWAYLTIKQLLDEKDAADSPQDDNDKEHSPEKKALALALKVQSTTHLKFSLNSGLLY